MNGFSDQALYDEGYLAGKAGELPIIRYAHSAPYREGFEIGRRENQNQKF